MISDKKIVAEYRMSHRSLGFAINERKAMLQRFAEYNRPVMDVPEVDFQSIKAVKEEAQLGVAPDAANLAVFNEYDKKPGFNWNLIESRDNRVLFHRNHDARLSIQLPPRSDVDAHFAEPDSKKFQNAMRVPTLTMANQVMRPESHIVLDAAMAQNVIDATPFSPVNNQGRAIVASILPEAGISLEASRLRYTHPHVGILIPAQD